MNRLLTTVTSLAAVSVAALSAQSLSRTAVAVTGIAVQVHSFATGTQSASIPLGTVLQDQQMIQIANSFASASFRAVLPAPGLSRFEGYASAQSLGNSGFFQGDVRVTLQSPAPTAVDLQLAAIAIAGGLVLGNIDVHDDGTPEVSTFPSPVLSANTSAVFGPAPLPIRMVLSGSATDTVASLALEVRVLAQLTAAATPYLTGCGGPTLAIAPITTSRLRVLAGGLPPAGIAAVVIGLGQTNRTLPFGGCTLGVVHDLLLDIPIDATGAGAREFVVPPAVTSFGVNLQVVGLDVTAPGAITTSDALHVLVTR